MTKFPLSLFNTLSCQCFTIAISIYNDSLTFPPWCLPLSETVLGCNQSKRPCRFFVCSVALEDSQLRLILSCRCSIDLVIISFLVHHHTLIRMNILIRTLQGGSLVLIISAFIKNILLIRTRLKHYSRSTLLYLFFDFWSDIRYPRHVYCLLISSVIIVIITIIIIIITDTTSFLLKVVNYLEQCFWIKHIIQIIYLLLRYFTE